MPSRISRRGPVAGVNGTDTCSDCMVSFLVNRSPGDAVVIDVAEEQARLAKSLEKLGKEIAGLNGRLNNPNFATSAPEDVVDEAKAKIIAGELAVHDYMSDQKCPG